jgi:hypothetical protein
MVVSGRITATVGVVVGAVSVTLLFVALSLVGLAFVAAGGGLVFLSLRHLDGFSSAKNGAQLGVGLGLLLGLPAYYSWACCLRRSSYF